ncbi:MAG: hypothetical protein ACT4OZ_01775 [Gemmatimonadota bacterium]
MPTTNDLLLYHPPTQADDQWFEVIDIETARLVASGSHDGRLGMFLWQPLLCTGVETGVGDTRVQVLSPTLVDAGTDPRRAYAARSDVVHTYLGRPSAARRLLELGDTTSGP